jgi:hypothetical protein
MDRLTKTLAFHPEPNDPNSDDCIDNKPYYAVKQLTLILRVFLLAAQWPVFLRKTNGEKS